MGITSNDIAAQRAMLERGEEKRKADWKLAERERLRDTFAAAALTGMMSRVSGKAEAFAIAAYKLADAMLREREQTNHDAVPEAKDRTAGELGGARVTGNTPTLTDEEREAVETAMDGYIAWMDDNVALEKPRVQAKLATLRSLLERLHT
jgi:hypothetical protein